ncbi:DUF3164 family protein [Cupriavidus metallidurans]|uniref:DUF3164 family protein n=1 Tax=Cupriavidus metallidurans TaxID=119219 RepID=A0A482INR0_9BURK|nr:DUF3164 family protein [Cupriavidus metallidurans]QBP09821.1 DUF3164 family protein [Cupriavidus metallidurans]
MQSTPEVIPAGFMKNARGHLVPEKMVKPIDRQRDETVRELTMLAKMLSNKIADFKKRVYGDVHAFMEMSAELYQAKIGGDAGNVTLLSYDGNFKMQLRSAERITFDERLQAAKTIIDELLTEWTEGSRPEIQTIIQGAFDTDKEGNLNTGRILSLRRLDIKDERWDRAMRAISESIQPIGTKTYVRFYERIEGSDEYRPISLDIAAI